MEISLTTNILRIIFSASPADGGSEESAKLCQAVRVAWGHRIEVMSLDATGAAGLAYLPLPVLAAGLRNYGAGLVPRIKGHDAGVHHHRGDMGMSRVWRRVFIEGLAHALPRPVHDCFMILNERESPILRQWGAA